jgi:hypothetical protein
VSRRIPLEAVRLYARARQLETEGVGPPNSPTRTEYSEVRNALRRLLNRPPWTAHPLDVDDGRDPPNPQWDATGAAELRRQLEEACA